jgi:GNAT superfamily N-acetyltransferase
MTVLTDTDRTAVALERVEAEAYLDLARSAPAEVVAEHGMAVATIGGATCRAVRSGGGSRLLNHVAGLGINEPAGDATVDAIEAWYRDQGCTGVIALAPVARPDGLEQRLLNRGYAPEYPWDKFHRGVEPLEHVETDLEIVVAGAELAEAFGTIIATAFDIAHMATWFAQLPGRPRWTCFVALAGGVPVNGGCGWLGFGATLPEFRGRRAQRALIGARIDAAREQGATHVATETGATRPGRPNFSHSNISACGFEPVYARPNLRIPAGTGTA